MKRAGSLTVVGTGIMYYAHLTIEARAVIKGAQKILYLVADPATHALIRRLNPSAESLEHFYGARKDRLRSYEEMVDEILSWVRKGLDVCAVFYGHPGVFVLPSHWAISQARDEGFEARMLPGISADACLYVDIGVDPGATGCQSFEATDFIVHRRRFDPSAALILWQIGAMGRLRMERYPHRDAVRALADRLISVYGREWEVVLYQAAQFPVSEPVIRKTTLGRLAKDKISPLMTLYVPPKVRRRPDLAFLQRIGLGLRPEPKKERARATASK